MNVSNWINIQFSSFIFSFSKTFLKWSIQKQWGSGNLLWLRLGRWENIWVLRKRFPIKNISPLLRLFSSAFNLKTSKQSLGIWGSYWYFPQVFPLNWTKDFIYLVRLLRAWCNESCFEHDLFEDDENLLRTWSTSWELNDSSASFKNNNFSFPESLVIKFISRSFPSCTHVSYVFFKLLTTTYTG